MIVIIKGDIIGSRSVTNQQIWQLPLKNLFNSWGKQPQDWELVWGDLFQLEVSQPEEALKKALAIKALIKKIRGANPDKKTGILDVRLSLGIGEKTFAGTKISESNGSAFINAAENFEKLRKENRSLGIQSPWPDFDGELNLYLKLAGIFMDKWTVSSAELIEIVLQHTDLSQEEIGSRLGIKQNSVSGRWKRACVNEVLEIEHLYRKKLLKLLP